ncbi:insulin-like growth factor-binding protein 4 [Rhincodon typus]|uniref:insulin-like growth factor-binding protein 4 n=1 Tax=Rhincodon typus TaxID=259920 RepID=UPI0020301AD7|nr:insulin-like growth factor-binding protein 4 [Rhincodon typus]
MCTLKCWSVLLALFSPLMLEASGPIRCLPCTEERLAHCPPVDSTCTEELVREPGCGCCRMCALSHGQPCGVYTARCGAGLRCYPQLEESKPLETLMQGRGICMELSEVERIQAIQAVIRNGSQDFPEGLSKFMFQFRVFWQQTTTVPSIEGWVQMERHHSKFLEAAFQ